MTSPVYLHIGLHKTATRFLQRSVFAHLDPAQFNYNPQPLVDRLYRHIRYPQDAQAGAAFIEEAARVRADGRKLLISLPDISGDMYNSHENARHNLQVLQQQYPQARVLYFVRNQADWLLSAYRQSIQKGMFGPLEVFLNFYDGEFRPKTAQRRGGMRNVDAHGLRLLDIYKAYADTYGGDNVYLIRYEDFQKHREGVTRQLAQWLQTDTVPVHKDGGKRHNRSFSALAIQLFCGGLKAPARPPRGADQLSDWDRIYSPMRFVRNLRRIFIRHVFDRLIYRDWDLLTRNDMRQKLNAYYQAENEEMARYARRPQDPA